MLIEPEVNLRLYFPSGEGIRRNSGAKSPRMAALLHRRTEGPAAVTAAAAVIHGAPGDVAPA